MLSKFVPFLQSQPFMQSFQPELETYGINYFSFSRNYHSGERVFFNSNAYVLENYLATKSYKMDNTETKPDVYKHEIISWDTVPFQSVLDNNARSFGYNHGIFMTIPYQNYCDIFAFATHDDNHKIINFYLNHTGILYQFIRRFYQKSQQYIDDVAQLKISHPFHKNRKILKFLNTSIASYSKLPKLSQREYQCFYMVIEGKSN